MPFPPYNFKMAANESVFLRSIRDVVREVLRDLQASVAARAFYRLDWLLDIVDRYEDSLSTTVDLDQIYFLLRKARECLCAQNGSFGVKWGVAGLHDSCLMFSMPFAPSVCFERVFYI